MSVTRRVLWVALISNSLARLGQPQRPTIDRQPPVLPQGSRAEPETFRSDPLAIQ
jgi:hypothetical protein